MCKLLARNMIPTNTHTHTQTSVSQNDDNRLKYMIASSFKMRMKKLLVISFKIDELWWYWRNEMRWDETRRDETRRNETRRVCLSWEKCRLASCCLIHRILFLVLFVGLWDALLLCVCVCVCICVFVCLFLLASLTIMNVSSDKANYPIRILIQPVMFCWCWLQINWLGYTNTNTVKKTTEFINWIEWNANFVHNCSFWIIEFCILHKSFHKYSIDLSFSLQIVIINGQTSVE